MSYIASPRSSHRHPRAIFMPIIGVFSSSRSRASVFLCGLLVVCHSHRRVRFAHPTDAAYMKTLDRKLNMLPRRSAFEMVPQFHTERHALPSAVAHLGL